MSDDTDTTQTYHRYRVASSQPGRATKPIHTRDETYSPGDEFIGVAGLAEPFGDRLEIVAEDVDADATVTHSGDGDDDSEQTAESTDAERERDPEPEPESADDGDAEDADDDAGEQEPVVEQKPEPSPDEAAEPVNMDELVAELGYDDLSVSDLRDELRGRDLSDMERRALLNYERQNKDRSTAKEAINGE